MTNDVRRAYFQAAIGREVYTEVPSDDKNKEDGDVVGLLKLCLCVTRDAAHWWQEAVSEHLIKAGFTRGAAFPAVSHHPQRGLYTCFHR